VAKSFRCKLVTPAAALLDDKVTYASVPVFDGLMGIQSSHAPMLVTLGMGELRLDMADDAKLGKGGSRSYALSGGTMKIAGDELTILAEQATPGESISASEAEAELSKLNSTSPGTPAGAEALRKQKAFARVKLTMAKSGKGI
jgi:F-type H+-transporting ATPase subunit epsilon